ncbi:MAG: hypothetical protein FJ290_31765 [Planctomycetes bacterium]|nr:hypothetical protein [Planctomycetota bacterium]
MGDLTRPRGMEAARLRQGKYARLRTLRVPEEALPGSLSLSYRRCGRGNCRCAEGEGHALWQLTFMAGGKKRVESVPAEWVEEVRRRVEEGRAFKEAWSEVLTANAELLVLRKKQRREKAGKEKSKRATE